jgi:hypothetical protein
MRRIVFLSPFARSEITGGIKIVYRHAELLTQSGFDASVWQPEGRPAWFESTARILNESRFSPSNCDVLVFPETLNGVLAELVQSDLAVKKVLYCQNHYYALFNSIPPECMAELHFDAIACQSRIAKNFLERVLHLKDVKTVPCVIDTDLFRPRQKRMQIAFIPRKLPRESAAIHRIFNLKYPALASMPWIQIENRSERETAEIFGHSAIVLSLPFLESFGLVPLEAMACGAIITGFDGYGGREYATPANGIWLPPDHLEEAADALAVLIQKLRRNDPEIAGMRDSGFVTVARYSKENTRVALLEFYTPLVR